jgi:hypothetical protein
MYAALLAMVGAAAAMWALIHYVQRLPDAPLCPQCGSVTCETDRGLIAGQILSVLPDTGLRVCRSCEWTGLMRWRPMPHHVRGK